MASAGNRARLQKSRLLTGCITAIGLLLVFGPSTSRAQTTITTSITFDGVPYTQPSGTLTVDGVSSPVLSLLNGATTSGIEGLTVGSTNTATISIQSGSSLSNSGIGSLGTGVGSSGTINIDGASSIWTNTGALYVGGSDSAAGGTGTINITNQGTLSVSENIEIYSGGTIHLGSSGTFVANNVHIDGGNLTFDGNQSLATLGRVTLDGHGSLTIPTLGSLIGADFYYNVGTLRITGDYINPTFNGPIVFDGVTAGDDQIFALSGNALTLGITSVTIGVDRRAGFVLENGRVASTNGDAIVAAHATSTATVTITGVGTVWNQTGNFYLAGTSTAAGGLGTLTIADGGTLSVSGTLKAWGGGTINLDGGTLNAGALDISAGQFHYTSGTLSGASSLSFSNGGLIVNDGILATAVTVSSGGMAKGSGTYSDLTVGSGGAASPGNSPGTMNSTTTSWDTDGTYIWEINALQGFGGSEGNDPGWDLWNAGVLTIGDSFTIEVHSLIDSTTDGALANWNPLNDYTWLIATSTNGAFLSLDNLVLNYDAFEDFNSLAYGTFGLEGSVDGNQLYLQFTAAAVPEPSSLLLASIGVAGLGGYYRRRKQAQAASGEETSADNT